jgi:hypothetical protein
VETDISDFALRAALSQKRDDDILYPIADHSKKIFSAEIYFEIHDKELLAIVDFFKIGRTYLQGALLIVLVYTNYQNLEYFTVTKV